MKKFLQHQKGLFSLLLALGLGMGTMYAYDFSAVCSTGQTLYYNVIDATNHYVEITYPGTENDPWPAEFTKPSGPIVLPTDVTHGGVTYAVTKIGDDAFYSCTGLTGSLTIGNSVTSIGDFAFFQCSGFTGTLTIPNYVTTIGICAFRNCTGFTGTLIIGSAVTLIGNQAFNVCYNLTSMTVLPATPPTLGPYVFYTMPITTPVYVHCESLSAYQNATGWNEFINIQCGPITFADANVKAICVANWDTDGDGELSYAEAAAVTSLGTVFHNNTDITSFDELQYFTGLTGIDEDAFGSDWNLSSITLPSSLTTIGDYAFAMCNSLTSITLPNTVTTIGNDAFMYCTGLTTIELPDALTTLGSRVFDYCIGLTSVEIPASVTSIGMNPFTACNNLASITVAEGNTVYSSPNNNAIVETATHTLITGLSSTVIPDDIQTISQFAFCTCTGLTSIVIPASVTNINYYAFENCSNLTEITVLSETPPVLSVNVFQGVLTTISVHVPCGSLEAYQTYDNGEPWGGFTNIQCLPYDDFPYVDDFETACVWRLINGDLTNQWVWGEAGTRNNHYLYISDNDGTTNHYTINSSTMVYATKLFHFEEGWYRFQYDWLAYGEKNYDYLRVALVPASVELSAGTSVPSGFSYQSLPEGWIALDGGQQLGLNSWWQTTFCEIDVPAGDYLMVFAWRNDYSIGTQPPAAIDNVSIRPITCFAPTELTAQHVGATQVTLGWTPSGDEDEWRVTLSWTNGDETYYVPYPAPTNPFTLTGLTVGRTYNAIVCAVCDSDNVSFSSNEISFTTSTNLCDDPITFPFTENFDGYTGTTSGSVHILPDCWTYINNTTNNSDIGCPTIFNYSSYAHSAPNLLFLKSYTLEDPQDQYAIMPPMENVQSLVLSLYARKPESDKTSTFYVGVMTDPEDASTFTEVATCSPSSTTYVQYTIPLNLYFGEGQYIAIKLPAADADHIRRGVCIDDLTVSENTCEPPTGLTVSNIHPGDLRWGALFSWDAEEGDVFQYCYLLSSQFPTEGASYWLETSPGSSFESYSDAFFDNTDYTFYLRRKCGDNEFSVPATVSFHTPCINSTFPFTENFDGYTGTTSGSVNILPNCWTRINTTTASNYTGYPTITNYSSYAYSGTNFLYFMSNGLTNDDPQDQFVILPSMDNVANLVLSLYARIPANGRNATFMVGVMTDPVDASTFTEVASYQPTSTTYTLYTIPLDLYTGNGTYIAIKMPAASSEVLYRGLCIDDVSVTENTCEVKSLPYSYGFEEEDDFGCWTMMDCHASTGRNQNAKHTGDYGFRFYYNTTPPQYLISPEFEGTTGVDVSFYYKNYSDTWPETFQVGYSTTTKLPNAFTWHDEVTANDQNTWMLYEDYFPEGTKYVAVKLNSNDKYYLYLDDFSFEPVNTFTFLNDGDWNDGSNWNIGTVPPAGSDVVIQANVTVPAGYIAVANEVTLDGGSITVADGGQLKHNTPYLEVTMQKHINAYSDANNIGDYYLLAFPFHYNIVIPAAMTANEGSDLYRFDPTESNAEWRNHRSNPFSVAYIMEGYLYASPESTELSLTGSTISATNEDVTEVTIEYSEGSGNVFNGWKLLGNPYTCNAYVYTLDEGDFIPVEVMMYDADGELQTLIGGPVAPMQGFFVKVTETTTIYIKSDDLVTPTGAVSGKFSINEEGKQVYFSQGNLQYIGSAATPYWKFADHQWDYFAGTTGQGSSDPNVDRDLFGWGTSGYDHGAICYQPWSTSQTDSDYYAYGQSTYDLYDLDGKADWGSNPISNGDDQPNQWRTLTDLEWEYLFNTRETASGIRFAKAQVNGVNGMILLPDDWSSSYYSLNNTNGANVSFDSNVITALQWNKLEQHGAIFLPAAGNRNGTSVTGWEYNGYYRTSVHSDNNSARSVGFGNAYLFPSANYNRNSGFAVRLVRPVQTKTPHTYIDLGLPSGTLWATCNVGANAPEEYGDYFSWGETTPKDHYSIDTYQYCNGVYNTMTKYCNNPNYGNNGFTDDLTTLLPEDDAATANWGNDWCMPAQAEWQELLDNTTMTWTMQNGVYGRLFTATNGNSLFLPAAGDRVNSNLYGAGSDGYYFSSSLYTDNANYAWGFYYSGSGDYYLDFYSRGGGGASVRPVRSGVVPEGAINGKFTINDEGSKVRFSQGNLQYQASTNTWKFADNQWDCLSISTGQNSANQDVDRDLFGWGTSGYDHGAVCYQPWSTSQTYSDYYAYEDGTYTAYDLNEQTGMADWGYNAISNGGNQTNQWRTLTEDEWMYVFNTRSTASGIRYAKATVNDVKGVILLPDNWSSSIYSLNNTNTANVNCSVNTISASQWTTLENAGAVFLPAAGYRDGTTVYHVGSRGYYWSATSYNNISAYDLDFSNQNFFANGYYSRSYGFSVRVVCPVE